MHGVMLHAASAHKYLLQPQLITELLFWSLMLSMSRISS